MDPTSAAILSAGVPALVAALTFVAGELIKVRQARTDRENTAIDQLLTVWADVGAVSTNRLHDDWKAHPERVDLSAAMSRMRMVFPKKDHVIYKRQVQLNDLLVRQTSDLGRVRTAGLAYSELLDWAANRRKGRRAAADKVTTTDQGSAAAK